MLTYNPFASLAKPKEKKLDAEKQKKFCGICRICGEPLTFITGNVIVCTNEKCKGYKHTKDNTEGEEIVYYTPVFRLLDEEGEHIASKLFD